MFDLKKTHNRKKIIVFLTIFSAQSNLIHFKEMEYRLNNSMSFLYVLIYTNLFSRLNYYYNYRYINS